MPTKRTSDRDNRIGASSGRSNRTRTHSDSDRNTSGNTRGRSNKGNTSRGSR